MASSAAAAADLPKDILNSIQKSLCLVDYLRFPCVCRSWRSAAEQNPHPPKPDPMPWAIYLDSATNSAVAIQFSPQNDCPIKTYRIPLPSNFKHHHIISSADHRLITINTSSEEELHVLNPFSSSWAPTSRLPSPAPYLNPPRYQDRLLKVVTDWSSAAVAIAEYWDDCFLDYTRLGSSSGRCWIRLEHDLVKAGDFMDIVPCRRRRGVFYALRFPGVEGATVVALDFSSPDVVKVEDITLNLGLDYISTFQWQWIEDLRLVCSSSHLFLVRWRLKVENGVSGVMKTRMIDVYKLLDEIPEKRRWVPVRSLDNCSFFLGLNQSISFSAADFPELRPDCIYLPRRPFQGFAEDFECQSIYNMKDGSWERFYGLDDRSYNDANWRTLWIIPHLEIDKGAM